MIERVAVVVPAADEKATIDACLSSIELAVQRLRVQRPQIDVRVTVVLDACTDGTANVVARHREVHLKTSAARCVGLARSIGSGSAATDSSTWLANTDADSTVPADWLTHQVQVANDGADVVLGTVIPVDLSRDAELSWWDAHTLADGHPHVHEANLGIRADVLDSLGGWRPLATGEDVDLARRAAEAQRTIHRCGATPVRTSTRADGRAPEGFSGYLRRLGRAEAS